MEPVPVTSTLLLEENPYVAPIYAPEEKSFPPLLTVRLFPDPPDPRSRESWAFHDEPAPVTTMLLLEEPVLLPRTTRPPLVSAAPPATTKLPPGELFPMKRVFAPLFHEDPVPVRIMVPPLIVKGGAVNVPLAKRVPPSTFIEEEPRDAWPFATKVPELTVVVPE